MKKSLLFLLLCIISIGGLSAQTTTYYVSQYDGNDSNDGSSWQNSYATVIKALEEFQGSGAGDYVIKIAQGFYIINGDSSGNLSEVEISNNKSLTLEGGYSQISDLGQVVGPNSDIYQVILDTYDSSAPSASAISAFRIDGDFGNNSNQNLTVKDLTIANARAGGSGGGNAAAFLTVERTIGGSFNLLNVRVNEWEAGNTNNDNGFLKVQGSSNFEVNVENSLIQRTTNRTGRGRFMTSDDRNNLRNIDVRINNSVFRNITGTGTYNTDTNGGQGSLINLVLDCGVDQGESSVEITNSTFSNIKRGLAQYQAAAVLSTRAVADVTLTGNVFYGNRGGNAGVIFLSGNKVFNSINNVYQNNFGGQRGGAISLHQNYGCDSSPNIVNIDGDTYFSNFSGIDALSGRGGALYIAGGDLGQGTLNKAISINNSTFYDNATRAYDGGAMWINTSNDLDIDQSTFCNNTQGRTQASGSAGSEGGALYVLGTGDLNVRNSKFSYNSSQSDDGGAISSYKDNTLIEDSAFDGNTSSANGGAVWTSNPTTINNSTFANSSARYGGAVYINRTTFGTTFPLTINGAVFTNNTATNGTGGAVYSPGILNVQNAEFTGNTAPNESGGAVRVENISNFTNVLFDGNTADEIGGAISVRANNTTTILNAIFTNNTSGQSGGAIDKNNGDLILTTTEFTNNSSQNSGGAIATAGVEIVVSESTFTSNTVTDGNNNGRGGAISTLGSIKGDNVVFESNTANRDGGAVFINNGSNNSFLNSKFVLNRAENGEGGAIRAQSASANNNLLVSESTFEENFANNGGAISLNNYGFATDRDETNISTVNLGTSFINNSAYRRGGAVYVNNPNSALYQQYNMNEASYINNSAVMGGAIFMSSYNLGTNNKRIRENVFFNNTASTDANVNLTAEGGAIYFNGYDNAVGNYTVITDVENNIFFGNAVNGDTDLNSTNGGSEIGIARNNSNTFRARIINFNNNSTQLVVDDNNYPNNYFGARGYINRSGNNQITTDPGINQTPDFSNVTIDPAVDVDLNINPEAGTLDENNVLVDVCPQNIKAPVTPLILSAQTSGTPVDQEGTTGETINYYTAVTRVNNDPATCETDNAAVAFSARTLESNVDENGRVLPNPIPEVSFTYDLTVVDNRSGQVELVQEGLTLDASSPNVTVAEEGDNIYNIDPDYNVDPDDNETEGSTANNEIRDLYKVYFLDVSEDLQEGKQYIYTIKSITQDGRTIDYNSNLYSTTLITEMCDLVCTEEPNTTGDALPTFVGVSTLDRNTSNWLPDNFGAYLVLESTTKGLIMPRLTTTEIDTNLGTGNDVEEGMIVFDTVENCIKMYYDRNSDGTMTWNCISNNSCRNIQ